MLSPPPLSSKIQVEVCQKTFKFLFQILMMFFSKIKEYVTEYSGYNRQVVYYVLFPKFYLPQKDKTSQQDKFFTVQTLVTCSNQCLHLFHTCQLVKLHHQLICGSACPVSIRSSNSLRLFSFYWRVFIFALTCLLLSVNGFRSFFIYIYIQASPSSSDEGVYYRWSPCPVVVTAPQVMDAHYMQWHPLDTKYRKFKDLLQFVYCNCKVPYNSRFFPPLIGGSFVYGKGLRWRHSQNKGPTRR